jgi:hypothetical protein
LISKQELSEKINQENLDLFPIEMRKALATGIVHTVRSNASTNKRRQLQTIFSDENLTADAANQSVAATSSISFSQSESTQQDRLE